LPTQGQLIGLVQEHALAADTIVAAAGGPPGDLLEPYCTLAGHPEVLAIGDMLSLNKLPGVAQPAIQEGNYVAKGHQGRLAGDGKTGPFTYFDKGSVATIGYRTAVADAFGVKVTGLPAYVMWMFIHMLYLIGWGNRLGTLYTWLRALVFSKNRGHHSSRSSRPPTGSTRTAPARPQRGRSSRRATPTPRPRSRRDTSESVTARRTARTAGLLGDLERSCELIADLHPRSVALIWTQALQWRLRWMGRLELGDRTVLIG
jgi:hypothetical protein